MFGSAPTWLVVLEVLVFTIGAVAFAVVLGLSRTQAWRQTMSSADGVPGVAIAANSLLYCLVSVWIGIVVLTGRPFGLGLLTIFTVITYVFPPLIIAETVAGDRRREALEGRSWQVVLWLVVAASAGLSVFVIGLYAGWWQVRVRATFFNVSIGTLFLVAVGVAMAAARVRARRGTARQPRPEARWVARLFVASAVLALTLMITGGDIRTVSYPFSLAMRMLPLAFLVAGAYADGRAAFYDLLIKRVTLTLLAMSILVAAVAVVHPLLHGLPPALFAILAGILLGPLALAFLALGRWVSVWLDARWLGRRFTPGDAIEHLLAATRASSDHAVVAARATEAIGQLFDAEARVCGVSETTGPQMSVAVAPVGDDLVLEVTRRDESRVFYSEDLALVQSVARVLGLEFTRVALERQRQVETARALRAQINPHFLFNALNAIGGSLHGDPRVAESAVEQLASVFRYTLRGTTSEWVTLGDELDAVRAYLSVEQARFGARLQTRVSCAPEVATAAVPPLVVLTLVENAIKHGVAESLGDVSVSVRAFCAGDTLTVEVVDTGAGLDDTWDAGRSAGGGFGLASVRERLHLLCGAGASLTGHRETATGETSFIVRLPLTAGPS